MPIYVEDVPNGVGIQVRVTVVTENITRFNRHDEEEAVNHARELRGPGDYIVYTVGVTGEQLQAKADRDAANLVALRKD